MRITTSIAVPLAALSCFSCSRTPGSPTVVLIVRQAEKVDNSEDPPLTEAGMRCARALIRAVEDSGVCAIHSTQFKRNRDTALPAAEHLHIPVTEARVIWTGLETPGGPRRTGKGETLRSNGTGRGPQEYDGGDR